MSGVKVVQTNTVVDVCLDLAYAPEVAVGTYAIAPDRLVITRTSQGFYRAEVRGRRVLKNGLLGKSRHTMAWSAANVSGKIPSAPSWVQSLLYKHMPPHLGAESLGAGL